MSTAAEQSRENDREFLKLQHSTRVTGANRFAMVGTDWCPNCAAAEPAWDAARDGWAASSKDDTFHHFTLHGSELFPENLNIDTVPAFVFMSNGKSELVKIDTRSPENIIKCLGRVTAGKKEAFSLGGTDGATRNTLREEMRAKMIAGMRQ